MAEHLSVFDILKIGVGPSSSHTLGPWRAALRLIEELQAKLGSLEEVQHVQCLLYGSLAKTGIGHGTDVAVYMGLLGADPVTVPVEDIQPSIEKIKSEKKLMLNGEVELNFDVEEDLKFLTNECLEYHPNGMSFLVQTTQGDFSFTYYSIGGGFVVKESEDADDVLSLEDPEFCIDNADDILQACQRTGMDISDIAWENELTWQNESTVRRKLDELIEVMQECIYRGAHTEGILPGGLRVRRRASGLNKNLLGDNYGEYKNYSDWLTHLQTLPKDMMMALDHINIAALAVNEENASFGRVVTAPTNGAAGVIPAVLHHLRVMQNITQEQQYRFLLSASTVGMVFKKGATISAAMGGCQAEIGVSSAMAAAGYCEVMGGTVKQSLEAAEIAMEHHLGLTCDPVSGLVQIPCIERNCMGAIKAITAGQLSIKSDPYNAKVSLDDVVKTMWETAKDMNNKYKETADGGLAFQFSERLTEC